MATLDTDLRQVLVRFPNDGQFEWHHRCLAVQGAEGTWIGITPDHDVEIIDLTQFGAGIIPLRRASPFPVAVRNRIYGFDPFEGNAEQELRDRCIELARVLGFALAAQPVPALGTWRVSDTGSESFGDPVPEEALGDPDLVVVRDEVGLVKIDDEWCTMARVKDADLDSWKLQRWTGGGRDPRIAGHRVDVQGRRYIPEVDAIASWRPPKAVPKDNPLQGPSVVAEFFDGLRSSGRTLAAHDQEWRGRSGVPEFGICARFHTALSEVLRYAVTVDQLDPTNCISLELVNRYLVMVESACDRNPKAPDWDGLEALVTPAISLRGAVEVPKFQNWLSSNQRDRAVILKQGRLLREERASEQKRKKDNKKDGGGDQ